MVSLSLLDNLVEEKGKSIGQGGTYMNTPSMDSCTFG